MSIRPTLCGWVHRRRDLGGLIFIDMRDREGIIQVFSIQTNRKHSHWHQNCVMNSVFVSLVQYARPESQINKDMATGEIEVFAHGLEIINRSGSVTAGFQPDQHRRTASEIPLSRSASPRNGRIVTENPCPHHQLCTPLYG